MLKLNVKRESGIELLKILSLFIIVLCHVYSTFATTINPISNVAFFDELTFTSLEYFIYQIFITFGYIGNMIFFACSAWFLADSKHNKIEKIINIWLNVLIISVIFLLIYCLLGYETDKELLFKCLLPISNENNWYITAYIMFYAIYPFINTILDKLNKKQHFVLALILFIMYFVFDYLLIEKAFYKNDLLMFIVIYIIVTYIKKYMDEYNNNLNKNILVLIITSLIFYSFIFINFAIMPISIKWHVLNNPFFLIMAISLINIFSKIKIHNVFINTISALSLYVYLTHDNIIFREIFRPQLVSRYLISIGINAMPVKIVLFTTLLFIACVVVSYLYSYISKYINKLAINIKNILVKMFV